MMTTESYDFTYFTTVGANKKWGKIKIQIGLN